VKAVKMRRTKVGAEVLAFDSISRTPPSDESGDRDYHLRNAVSTLAERNNFGRTPLVVSIPEPAFSRFIPLPPVDKKRIPEVVRYEARQQIPFPIEEVVWDYQPVREPAEIGEETEVAIFSLRSQFVYALLANLSLCRLQPRAVLPVPLALYNFLTFDRDVARGTIVVDIGAGSTDILICDPENFRVRNITVSGNGITRALADRLKIARDEAEALKRECTDPAQAQRLFKLIQPTLNDLIGQVQRTIGFFKSQIHNVRIEQALLLGNTFRLPGVAEYFVDQLGADRMPSDVLERVTLASSVDGEALKDMLPSLGVVMGLALQGIGVGRVQVNLMPHELLARQEVAKKRPSAVAAVACLAVLLGTSFLAVQSEKAQVEADLEAQKKTTERIQKLQRAEQSYQSAKKKITGPGGVKSKLVEPMALSEGHPKAGIGYNGCLEATNALNEVLNRMSSEIVLRQIRLTPASVQLEAAEFGPAAGPVPSIQISLAGRTDSPNIQFLQQQLVVPLQTERRMVDAKPRPVFAKVLDGFRPTSAASGIEFTLECHYVISD
jgi:type IV pilus assembly protein PilM